MLVRAIDEAETHTGDYYCIPPRGWQRLRYDLITRSDDEWEPLPSAPSPGFSKCSTSARGGEAVRNSSHPAE